MSFPSTLLPQQPAFGAFTHYHSPGDLSGYLDRRGGEIMTTSSALANSIESLLTPSLPMSVSPAQTYYPMDNHTGQSSHYVSGGSHFDSYQDPYRRRMPTHDMYAASSHDSSAAQKRGSVDSSTYSGEQQYITPRDLSAPQTATAHSSYYQSFPNGAPAQHQANAYSPRAPQHSSPSYNPVSSWQPPSSSPEDVAARGGVSYYPQMSPGQPQADVQRFPSEYGARGYSTGYSSHQMPGADGRGLPPATGSMYPMIGAPQNGAGPLSPAGVPYGTPPNAQSRHHANGTSPQQDADSARRVPKCWEHGCNGRQFSTFSNLLRHQRERAGTAAKSTCPRCGAEFTRTTARNGHMNHAKCRPRRSPETSG